MAMGLAIFCCGSIYWVERISLLKVYSGTFSRLHESAKLKLAEQTQVWTEDAPIQVFEAILKTNVKYQTQ